MTDFTYTEDEGLPEKLNTQGLQKEITEALGLETGDVALTYQGPGTKTVEVRLNTGEILSETTPVPEKITVHLPDGQDWHRVLETILAHAPIHDDTEELTHREKHAAEEVLLSSPTIQKLLAALPVHAKGTE